MELTKNLHTFPVTEASPRGMDMGHAWRVAGLLELLQAAGAPKRSGRVHTECPMESRAHYLAHQPRGSSDNEQAYR